MTFHPVGAGAIPGNPMTTLGDMIDGAAGGAAQRLAGNTSATKQFLTSTGAGGLATAPAWGTIAASDLPANNPTGAWGPTDQGLLAWNYDGPASTNGAGVVLATAGTMYVMAVKVPTAISVTNIVMILQTNGGTLTSAQCFGALYQGAGGALIGRTADQAAAWGAGAVKVLTMALNGGPFAVAAGVVYVGVWFNGTTGPAFYRSGTTTPMLNVGLADAASRWGVANTGLTNAASTPGTLGTVTATGVLAAAMWVALS